MISTRIISLLLPALLLTNLSLFADETPNSLTEAEQRTGWKLLFDGKTTAGWRNFKKENVTAGWVIEEGALVRKNKGAGDIITTQQYDSFELSLEYKISKAGNSGLMFHVTEEASRPWQTGPEIQIQDHVNGHDPQKSGWLYQLYKSNIDATRPAGEWNHLRIRITPKQCAQYMNGVRYTRYVKGSKDWNKRVAASKFSKYPLFGKPTKGHICLQDHGDLVAYRNIKIRELDATNPPTDPVDGVLPYKAATAFANLNWANWAPVSDAGKAIPLRPIVLTHAGDGSNRVFVATQRGVIHLFDNNQNAKKSYVYLDISDSVTYQDKQNEEGFLSLAFHPQYKKNGQFFVYYSSKANEKTSIISRFTVSADNPSRANAASEEVLMTIKQPFWNHNGATLAFGKDGYLYISLGDGGSGNDPTGNGQNLSTLLGSVLRIDVDHKANGKNYVIPKDNPFINQKGARPETYAYGFRNPWRISFDRQTGDLWVADVGQDTWEEINVVEKGGNYGWNVRESAHMFGAKGKPANKNLKDPIWEYDHEVGKSITGGYVYRGERFPALVGSYIYADYVTGKIWALKYDAASHKVLSNKVIKSDKLPIMSFGEDETGEIYFMTEAANGKGIYRLEPK